MGILQHFTGWAQGSGRPWACREGLGRLGPKFRDLMGPNDPGRKPPEPPDRQETLPRALAFLDTWARKPE